MNDEQARERVDGTLLITTGTPFMRFRLDAGDDATLDPVEGGDAITLTWRELSQLYNRGDVYLPQHTGDFGPAVDHLAGNAVIMTDGGTQSVPPERQWFRTVTTGGKGGGLSVGAWFQIHPPYGADKVVLGPYDERVDPETVKEDYRNGENIHRRPGESLRGDDDGE